MPLETELKLRLDPHNVPALLRHPLLKGGTSRSTRRLRTIFHTNLATAHAAGQWARIQQNKRALPYLKYIPSYANSPRDGHKRYYNLILPVEHELWAQIMPPNGYGCLNYGTPIDLVPLDNAFTCNCTNTGVSLPFIPCLLICFAMHS